MAAPIPRVALMFLTRGALPYEQLWAEWFRDVTEVLPLEGLQVLKTDPCLSMATCRSIDQSLGPTPRSLIQARARARCMWHSSN